MENMIANLTAKAVHAYQEGSKADRNDVRGYWLGAYTTLLELIAELDGCTAAEAGCMVEDIVKGECQAL